MIDWIIFCFAVGLVGLIIMWTEGPGKDTKLVRFLNKITDYNEDEED